MWSFVDPLLTLASNEEIVLHYFLVVLKRPLQNYVQTSSILPSKRQQITMYMETQFDLCPIIDEISQKSQRHVFMTSCYTRERNSLLIIFMWPMGANLWAN